MLAKCTYSIVIKIPFRARMLQHFGSVAKWYPLLRFQLPNIFRSILIDSSDDLKDVSIVADNGSVQVNPNDEENVLKIRKEIENPLEEHRPECECMKIRAEDQTIEGVADEVADLKAAATSTVHQSKDQDLALVRKKTEIDKGGDTDNASKDPEGDDLHLESFGKKKKKKKRITLLDQAEHESKIKTSEAYGDSDYTYDELLQRVYNIMRDRDNASKDPEGDDLDLENFGKKKKKKKRNTLLDQAEHESEIKTCGANGDLDYTYDELLQRVYNIMREKNPKMVVGEKKKFVMKPPITWRVGRKNTALINFYDIATTLNREPNHLQAFLLSELGTTGSIDGNNYLNLKGKFFLMHIKTVLRRYLHEYVFCRTCKSHDTNLIKVERLFFIQCNVCNSKSCVEPIKVGFRAIISRRSKDWIRFKVGRKLYDSPKRVLVKRIDWSIQYFVMIIQ